MTIYYVDSAATGTNAGTSWTNAWTALSSAITNVTTAGDVIYISHTHNEQLAADTTYPIGANHVQSNPLKIYSVNKTGDVLTKGAFIGHDSSNRSIVFTGTGTAFYLYGVTLQVAGSVNDWLGIYYATSSPMRSSFILEQCSLYIVSNNPSSSLRFSGASGSLGVTNQALFLGCDFQFGNTAQTIEVGTSVADFVNCVFSSGSTHPSVLFTGRLGGSVVTLIGCQLENIGTIFGQGSWGQLIGLLQQCKLKSSFTLIDTASITSTSILATLLDCDSGDVHYRIGHADFWGELQVDTGIYCNDNIADTDLSWKIVSSANASFTMPYVTPWIPVYHSGTSAITPYLEILRSGSSSAFTDAEVWAEWSYKGTSGSTRATIDHDRCAHLGTPANQTASSKTATDWTGENATSWFGKIGPSASITPAEPGDLCFRICVGVASTTVYVDPQIRGLV